MRQMCMVYIYNVYVVIKGGTKDFCDAFDARNRIHIDFRKDSLSTPSFHPSVLYTLLEARFGWKHATACGLWSDGKRTLHHRRRRHTLHWDMNVNATSFPQWHFVQRCMCICTLQLFRLLHVRPHTHCRNNNVTSSTRYSLFVAKIVKMTEEWQPTINNSNVIWWNDACNIIVSVRPSWTLSIYQLTVYIQQQTHTIFYL